MASKRVICAVTNDLNQDQRLHRICNTLSKRKYLVTLVGREKYTSRKLPKFRFRTIRLQCRNHFGFLFYIEYNYRLFRYLQKSDYDIVNGNDLDTIIACRLSAWLKKKKFIFDGHEIFSHVPELKNKPIRKYIWKAIGQLFLRNSSYNYTVNESLNELLSSEYKIPFTSIYNYPLKNNAIQAKQKHSPVRLLYQGVLNEGRGLLEIIDAVKHMSECILYIAGAGVYTDLIKNKIESKNIENVKVFGFLNPKKLKELTAICDIGLNVLDKESKSYYYSSANKYFDYIAAGIPSISMNFPEYRKVNDEYNVSILIDRLSTEDIRTAILTLINNDELYTTLCNNCIIAHRDLSWNNEEAKLLEIYSS